jgi:3-deoxy-7-phosphoheptulonate synthase
MHFEKKLPIPAEIKQEYPLSGKARKIKKERDAQIREIFTGESDRFLLIIGPCSADNEQSVLEYLERLAALQKKVEDRTLIIPRIYTNKPRTTGKGYKGLLHQPDPSREPDLLAGIIAIRELHMRSIELTGMTAADEMLYPENYRYLDDLLGYVAVGARSVEDQQHRMVVSGMDIPVGMKNPTSGDLSVMFNSIMAAQSKHNFIYRGWDVTTDGNDLAHVVLRGGVNKHGNNLPNYHYEDLLLLNEQYGKKNLKNPAVVVDCNHSNSGKDPFQQHRIIMDVLHSCKMNERINNIVKGFMVESYIVGGNQDPDGGVYGLSITDACLGWKDSKKLIYDVAEQL